jgi:hypothetical protein
MAIVGGLGTIYHGYERLTKESISSFRLLL